MGHHELSTLAVRREGGRFRIVGDLAAALELELPDSVVLVGLGLPGLTVAATLAALRGRDLAFVRSRQKDHGTGRILDGADIDGRALVVVCAPEDLALLELVPPGHAVAAVALLTGPQDGPPASVPDGLRLPHADQVDPREHVDVLTGRYRTSSGFDVTRYIETLRAACTYPVATEFARRLEPRVAAVDTVCGIAHGGALLAAVAASRHGRVADLFWAPGADGSTPFTGPTCFLDDYIMIGAAQRTAALAVRPQSRRASHFVAVFGPVAEVDFGEQCADVLVVTEGGYRPPPSPFRSTGG